MGEVRTGLAHLKTACPRLPNVGSCLLIMEAALYERKTRGALFLGDGLRDGVHRHQGETREGGTGLPFWSMNHACPLREKQREVCLGPSLKARTAIPSEL